MKQPNKYRSIDKGAVAEQKVAAELLLRGGFVNWSTSDKQPYDFILDMQGNLLKIQVKGIFSKHPRGHYQCSLKCGAGATTRNYLAHEVDFYIIYIHPENVYYVIPYKEGMRSFCLTKPDNCKYNQYREAWEILNEVTYIVD